MADRLSQLQDAVNLQAENLYNSIGCLFNSAAPCSFDKSGKTPSQSENPDDMTEHKRVFATLIARNAKDIDALIESLPSEDSSAEFQVCEERSLGRKAKLVQRSESYILCFGYPKFGLWSDVILY
ncbi:mediator of RNA polymerase II transcription subunit 21 isoform X3 [Panulirus ornatus]|uniref:mediator of RNA polymerase II transcription subunit 21 isoform X3 n=1 Tax=Panulirus ornatus TaxID=150431 RepID=UPI003A87BE26